MEQMVEFKNPIHNTIDIDTPIVEDKKNLSPDNILEELDNVVAKFEETVEKAEKG